MTRTTQKKTEISMLRCRADRLLAQICMAGDDITAAGPRASQLVRGDSSQFNLAVIDWSKLSETEVAIIGQLIAIAEITVRCLRTEGVQSGVR